MAQSKLTTLSQQRSAKDLELMSRDSIKWLSGKIDQLRNPSSRIPSTIRDDDREKLVNLTSNSMLGRLYFFYYNPKTKDDLPYYDKFPLVLVLDNYKDGILALNLHYLPPKYRIMFIQKLLENSGVGVQYTKDYDIKRLKITYDILKYTTSLKEFRPCIKRYLYKQMGSKFLAVAPNEWDTAILLPVQQFKKAKASEVWSDSMSEARKKE